MGQRTMCSTGMGKGNDRRCERLVCMLCGSSVATPAEGKSLVCGEAGTEEEGRENGKKEGDHVRR